VGLRRPGLIAPAAAKGPARLCTTKGREELRAQQATGRRPGNDRNRDGGPPKGREELRGPPATGPQAGADRNHHGGLP
jgi:hypothetical protein